MDDFRRSAKARLDELLFQISHDKQILLPNPVLAEAKRGLQDPDSLTALEIQRVCFAVVAFFAELPRY